MLLKSLELQGFKTFPDKTLLKFEEGITAVVGPNGSGKSNISDAMRWVLGEQSTRALRCTKMEDVIFSGTPQRKAQGFAEVTITIDNTDRQLNFDGDTVAITRRYYRSGESEYRINKDDGAPQGRPRAVHGHRPRPRRLFDHRSGQDRHIVSAKSEDRREIFEEAAGISRFRYRKEEAERRLERAEENLVRLRDILAELEGRLEPLRVQSEKAREIHRLRRGEKEPRDRPLARNAEPLRPRRARGGGKDRRRRERLQRGGSGRSRRIARQIEQNFAETNGCTAQMDAIRAEAASTDESATRKEGEISGRRKRHPARPRADRAAARGDRGKHALGAGDPGRDCGKGNRGAGKGSGDRRTQFRFHCLYRGARGAACRNGRRDEGDRRRDGPARRAQRRTRRGARAPRGGGILSAGDPHPERHGGRRAGRKPRAGAGARRGGAGAAGHGAGHAGAHTGGGKRRAGTQPAARRPPERRPTR